MSVAEWRAGGKGVGRLVVVVGGAVSEGQGDSRGRGGGGEGVQEGGDDEVQGEGVERKHRHQRPVCVGARARVTE